MCVLMKDQFFRSSKVLEAPVRMLHHLSQFLQFQRLLHRLPLPVRHHLHRHLRLLRHHLCQLPQHHRHLFLMESSCQCLIRRLQPWSTPIRTVLMSIRKKLTWRRHRSILRTCQQDSLCFSDRRDRVQCRSAVHGATEAIRLVHAVLLVAYAPFVVEAMEMKMNDHVSNHRGQIQSLTSVHDVG